MARRRLPESLPELHLRIGKVRKLPADYQGERHVIVAKRLGEGDGRELVEFEEVPGPAPAEAAADPHCLRYVDILLVESPGASRAEAE
jgi:hypothetical protein